MAKSVLQVFPFIIMKIIPMHNRGFSLDDTNIIYKIIALPNFHKEKLYITHNL